MKAILKFKPLFIVLAFMTIAMSSINAAGISGTFQADDVFQYHPVPSFVCPGCGQKGFWEIAFDQNDNPYHGICTSCGFEKFY